MFMYGRPTAANSTRSASTRFPCPYTVCTILMLVKYLTWLALKAHMWLQLETNTCVLQPLCKSMEIWLAQRQAKVWYGDWIPVHHVA